MKRIMLVIALTLSVIMGPAALAGTDNDPPVTPATEFHGLPGNNGGFSDQEQGACPAGTGDGCDGGIHGIATNPGQSGNKPQDRDEPPSCDMHAGLGAANKNCE